MISQRPRATGRVEPETLKQLHAMLVHERQQLRREGAAAEELERNRLAIVRCQWELSHALIECYFPPAAAPSAA